MIRYLVRRLLQMIPTLFGVILITFILFNLVGGSPARMTLGDKASARDLEAFDEQRGANRPLFWGRTTATRLYAETDFSRGAGPWTGLAGVERIATGGVAVLRITGPVEVAVPLAFDPFPGVGYRFVTEVSVTGPATLRRAEGAVTLTTGAVFWEDRVTADRVDERPVISVAEGAVVELHSFTVRRVHDQPWSSQWTHYLGQLARFDFGRSHAVNRSVLDLLRAGIGPTLLLAAPILIGETVISLALALGCAYYRNRWFDRLVLFGCVLLMSVNYLVWIVAGQYLLGYRLGWFPVWGFESWRYLLLPVLIGIAHGLGPNVRFYRTILLEEMHRDYVRTARAKGIGTPRILFVHVLKNAMIPVITNVALSLPFLYTGSLLLETFFGIPGLGYLSINAINSSDVDVVRAVVLIGSLLYLAANLIADLCYAWVDPRVKLS
jgi:peptide/nickel transport system permease protein